MIENYLLKRKNLKGVVFILDMRRGLTELDAGLKEWLDSKDKNYVLVATKSDKLKPAEKKQQLEKLRSKLPKGEEILPYSSKTGEGRKELWKWIANQADIKRGG